MRTIVLDCRLLGGDTAEERRATHERLAEAFGFPSYYGFNLDALYDCLTSEEELSGLGVLKLIDCIRLEDSYLRLRYQVIG